MIERAHPDEEEDTYSRCASLSGLPTEACRGDEHLRDLVVTITQEATAAVPAAAQLRRRAYALEEDLRSGLVQSLRDRGELVITEARLQLRGWSARLGGFDIAVVDGTGRLVVGETKWADGKLYESIWDIFKLASAATAGRIRAAIAFYGAPLRDWERSVPCAELFEPVEVEPVDLIGRYPALWSRTIGGSSATVSEAPRSIRIVPWATAQVTVDGRLWEVRAIRVCAEGPWVSVLAA